MKEFVEVDNGLVLNLFVFCNILLLLCAVMFLHGTSNARCSFVLCVPFFTSEFVREERGTRLRIVHKGRVQAELHGGDEAVCARMYGHRGRLRNAPGPVRNLGGQGAGVSIQRAEDECGPRGLPCELMYNI